jgi:hypothetical protein
MATERRLPTTAPYEAAGDTARTARGSIGDALEEAARYWGAATALVAPGEDGARWTWSFAELRNDAKRVARALLQRYRSGEGCRHPGAGSRREDPGAATSGPPTPERSGSSPPTDLLRTRLRGCDVTGSAEGCGPPRAVPHLWQVRTRPNPARRRSVG